MASVWNPATGQTPATGDTGYRVTTVFFTRMRAPLELRQSRRLTWSPESVKVELPPETDPVTSYSVLPLGQAPRPGEVCLVWIAVV
jgi:hypothetical protein